MTSSSAARAGQTALITGSSRGLGRSLAYVFAQHGCDVVLHGRDRNALAETREGVLRHEVDCEVVEGEITSAATIDALRETAARRNLDILINNAGVYLRKPFRETDPAEFKRVIDVNLVAPVILTQAILPIFQQKRSGLVVSINSMAGRKGSDGESAYCASKHGLRGFTSSVRIEANSDRIRFLDFYLGAMNTAMAEGRRDPEKCIQTSEAADFIWRVCRDYPSLKIDEIDLSRRNY